jgi:hypothetical protein
MKTKETRKEKLSHVLLIKKCHCCGELNEGRREMERCQGCNKSFLPSNYFSKVHAKNSLEYQQLFAHSHELHEDDIVKGLGVIW